MSHSLVQGGFSFPDSYHETLSGISQVIADSITVPMGDRITSIIAESESLRRLLNSDVYPTPSAYTEPLRLSRIDNNQFINYSLEPLPLLDLQTMQIASIVLESSFSFRKEFLSSREDTILFQEGEGLTLSFTATYWSKILGYVPILGSIAGLYKIAKGYQEYKHFEQMDFLPLKERGFQWMVRGALELMPVLGGLICLITDLSSQIFPIISSLNSDNSFISSSKPFSYHHAEPERRSEIEISQLTQSYTASNLSKFLGYIPVLGIITGLFKLAKGWSEYSNSIDLKENGLKWMCRGVLEMVPVIGGSACLITDIYLTYYSPSS